MENDLIAVEYYSYKKPVDKNSRIVRILVKDSEFYHFKCAKIIHKGLNEEFCIEQEDDSIYGSDTLFNLKIKNKINELNNRWRLNQYQISINEFNNSENILNDGLKSLNQYDWDKLKENIKFNENDQDLEKIKEPTKSKLLEFPEKPQKLELPLAPEEEKYFIYVKEFSLFANYYEWLINNKPIEKSHPAWKLKSEIDAVPFNVKNYKSFVEDIKDKIFEEVKINAQVEYENACDEWEKNIQVINSSYESKLKEWEGCCDEIRKSNTKIERDYLSELEIYKRQIRKRKEDNLTTQTIYFNHLDELRESYLQGDPNSIIEYLKIILENSKYPVLIEKKFEFDYNPKTKILVVEYALPPIDAIPTLKDVKLVKEEWKKYYISENQAQKNFENTLYKITLRTLSELFYTDEINAIDAICFNGWVNGINKATGKRENNCILSIQVNKAEFQEIDLRYVDPKTCFKALKGVSSNKLSSITSIQPIIQINKKDKRFVDSHDVTANIDDSTNLAAMDWEEFEHLIREIFEKEFSSNGGEVKVTQTSRDGGVDAVAFDPDPIRGGKIVIQAKRYTNTVGVSAVRDLYGTVLNEGATKGILVTTSDYGSDSYEFAKGKPLTLLNGSNLLYLLEKHGHKAKIDIEEARRLMKS